MQVPCRLSLSRQANKYQNFEAGTNQNERNYKFFIIKSFYFYFLPYKKFCLSKEIYQRGI